MPQVTIPDLDPRTLDELASEARRRNLDLGAAAGVLLRERLGTAEIGGPGQADLRSLAGTWTDEEAEEFLAAVAPLRRSALDVPGVKTDITAAEIVAAVREGRERG